MKKLLGIAALSAVLAGGYALTSKTEAPIAVKYDAPANITAQSFSTQRTPFQQQTSLEQTISIGALDLNKPFDITTGRYRLVRDEDNVVSRNFGKYVGSLPAKMLFFDTDAGSTPDAERAKAVLSILEHDESINDVTVRLGHNRVFYDTWRLFTDEKITQRNGIVARIALGLPTLFLSEPLAELTRSDYYNPMTQTVVLYSNIEAVAGHELGHHQDYQRWSNDWAYALTTAFPPMKLYKEFVASQRASDTLPEQDENQIPRYLLPAFLTYLVGGWAVSRKMLQGRALTAYDEMHPLEERVTKRFELLQFLHDKFRSHADVDKLKEDERPDNPAVETARHFFHQNIMLLSAIGAYTTARQLGPWVASSAFAAGMLTSDYLCDVIGDRFVPYTHERQRMMTRRVAKKAYRIADHAARAICTRLHHTYAPPQPEIDSELM